MLSQSKYTRKPKPKIQTLRHNKIKPITKSTPSLSIRRNLHTQQHPHRNSFSPFQTTLKYHNNQPAIHAPPQLFRSFATGGPPPSSPKSSFDPKRMFDPRDQEAMGPDLESLDDVFKQQTSPYSHLKSKPPEKPAFDPVFDHTIPDPNASVSPARWSYPPDAEPPRGFKKYHAEDGTWWRREDEASDHEPYYHEPPSPYHEQLDIPYRSKRVDRRTRYYTYMHRNPIDHTYYGREASYMSQWMWFMFNRTLDFWDTVVRVLLHTLRPVWILSKIMFRIPEFTIKFAMQIKVEIFRYIERRWGPPEKRDPEVYKIIPGMLEATFNATKVVSDYFQRWGVRDPDVGAFFTKYKIFELNEHIAQTVIQKLDKLQLKHYKEYLQRDKERMIKLAKNTPEFKAHETEKWFLKLQSNPKLYSLLTGLTPDDPLYGKPISQVLSQVKTRTPSTREFNKFLQIRSDLKSRQIILPLRSVFIAASIKTDPWALLLDHACRVTQQCEDQLESSLQSLPKYLTSNLPPRRPFEDSLYVIYSVFSHHAQNNQLALNTIETFHRREPLIGDCELQPNLQSLDDMFKIDDQFVIEESKKIQEANPQLSPAELVRQVVLAQQQRSTAMKRPPPPQPQPDESTPTTDDDDDSVIINL